MISKIKPSIKSIFFVVVVFAMAVCLVLAVYNKPSEKILKLTALAKQGDANAQFELGNMYFLELGGVSLDYSEAMKWYREAAGQGNANAKDMLGFMYKNGCGVPKDLVRAYMWDNLATAQDKKYAKFRDRIKKDMTPEQITEGERLTHEWMLQYPKP